MIDNPLVIYHGNCVDGFTAAWCFYRKYGDEADYVAGVYQEPPPDVTGRDVYLVDFSYKRAVVEDMIRKARTVTLIDHHKTALEDLKDLEGLTQFVSLEHSGAMLAWKYLFGDTEPPRVLRHVEDRVCGSLDYRVRVKSTLPLDENGLRQLAKEGDSLNRKHDKHVRDLVALCKRDMDISGWVVPVASIPPMFASDAGHLMAQDQWFAACYWDTEHGRVFSLRSAENGRDVSEIAKQYGGGGHKHAAEFTVSRYHKLAVR